MVKRIKKGFDFSNPMVLPAHNHIRHTSRVAVKGDNPSTWEKVTGAKGEIQPYQIVAIKALRSKGLRVSVAYMDEFVDPNLLGLGCGEDYDVDGLKVYRRTKARLKARGLLEQAPKPLKPVFNPQKPKEALYWEDKGDIT